VFERFTERARQVVVLAQDEARALKHNYIGTEHLLLGLLREEEGVAALVLESFDVTLEEVRAQVARIVGQGDEATSGQIPFTPRAKKVLELSLREAISLGHNYIGTEHILLGVVRENEGVAARILLDFDADAETIRNEIIRILSGRGRRQPRASQPSAPFDPPSPPFVPEVGEELRRLREEKEEAIDQQRFDDAAALRDRERRLTREARSFALLWSTRDSELSAPHTATEWAEAVELEYEPARGRMPKGVRDYAPERRFPTALLLGWALFAVAFGFGVLIGLVLNA
jgi:ATP-dependent Clp protease ATP-binding subunit ClpA